MQQSMFLVPRQLSKRDALAVVGSLSSPGKMPGHGYSIPAIMCKTGSNLRDFVNSVCNKCYAMKGRYRFPNVQAALQRRAKAFNDPLFPAAMVTLINDLNERHFRWFDSGDLQSVAMLHTIAYIAERTPNCMHWLPTREYKIVEDYHKLYGDVPDNLIVRVSAQLIDHEAPKRFTHTSTVHTTTPTNSTYVCPAPEQGNKCKLCRACWDKTVTNVSYHVH